jgi:hypothetical protein
MPDAAWKAECEAYLTAQGPYLARSRRYQAVREALHHMGFQQGDVVYDVGAGMCDFARYMYTSGECFRYVAIDGAIDGCDIEHDYWMPGVVDWYVCIETIEHLNEPFRMLDDFKQVTKGVAITTPNPARTDVLALDPTHKSWVSYHGFVDAGYLPNYLSIHYEEDTILATYQP